MIYDSFLTSLSTKERARYERALDRYKEIQFSNAAKKVSSLTPQEGAFLAQQGYDDNSKLAAYFMSVSRSATVNDELFNSSLFRRLLEGIEPLPFAPPLSFSFPWYDVIEGEGPWPVVVVGVEECKALPYLRRYLVNPVAPNLCVSINAALWRVQETLSETQWIVTQPGWVDLGFKRLLTNTNSMDSEPQWVLSVL